MAMNPRLLRPLATGFNPRSIAGLNLWIDFSDTATVTLDVNNKIQDVLDKSGLGQHGTQGTSGNRLGVSTINGRQCADNGTSSNAFRVTYATGSTNNNWRDSFVVAQWDAGGSTFPGFNSPFSTSAASGTNNGSMLAGTSGAGTWAGGSVLIGTGRRWQTNGGNYFTGASQSDFDAFPFFGGPFIFHGNAQENVGVDGWQIGSDRALAARGWLGRIGEVLSFNRSLSDSESLRVNRYLARKWGVTLA